MRGGGGTTVDDKKEDQDSNMTRSSEDDSHLFKEYSPFHEAMLEEEEEEEASEGEGQADLPEGDGNTMDIPLELSRTGTMLFAGLPSLDRSKRPRTLDHGATTTKEAGGNNKKQSLGRWTESNAMDLTETSSSHPSSDLSDSDLNGKRPAWMSTRGLRVKVESSTSSTTPEPSPERYVM
jgi:hypothetical protein